MNRITRFNLKSKLILILLVLSLGTATVVGYLAWNNSRTALTNTIFNQLTSVWASKAFQIVHQGGVLLTAQDAAGGEQTIARLAEGDFFGIIDILRPDTPSLVSVTATTDLQVIIIPDEVIRRVLEDHHAFALELNYIAEERKKAVDTVQGVTEIVQQNGWLFPVE